MPKIKKSKKNKIVSLVAYESGAESGSEKDNVSENGSNDEESNESDDSTESTDNETQSKKTSDNEELEITTNNDENLSNGSNRQTETLEVRESIEIEMQNNILEQNEATGLTESKYTLENGFPPGCANITLPAAPSAPCSQALQNKIIQVMDRMEKYNYSINDDVYSKKSFKNPSIYEKFIESYGIDEYGSSFPTHVEDLKSNGYSFYDELDQVQRAEWVKKENQKNKAKVEIATGVKKK